MRERGWKADETPNEELDVHGDPPFSRTPGYRLTPRHVQLYRRQLEGVQFNETMLGHLHIGSNITDLATAESVARAASSTAQMTIRVTAHRNSFYSYIGIAHGTFACGALSLDPLRITDGCVEFFTIDESVSDARRLVYNLNLLTTSGVTYRLHGYKRIDPSVTLSLGRT